MVGASGSITPDGRGKTVRPAFKRSVTWADGTAEPKQVDLAVSIPRYKNNKEGGYTEYCLEVYQFIFLSSFFDIAAVAGRTGMDYSEKIQRFRIVSQ